MSSKSEMPQERKIANKKFHEMFLQSEINQFISNNKGFVFLLAALIFGFFLRWYNLEYFSFMTADESVYTQAVYAISKGYIPYRDVFIAHPPMHFLVQYPFMLISSSLLMVRFSSILLGFGSTILLLYSAKALYSKRVAIVATIMFALSPYAIFFNKFAIVENTLLFFVSLVFFTFFKYYRNGDRKWLMLCGIFVGVALMTKYTALYVAIILVAFIAIKKKFKNFALFMACICIIPVLFLLALLLSNTFTSFYVQTISMQLIRFGISLSTKMWEITQYSVWISPLALLAFFALPLGRKKEDLLLTFLCVVPLLIMLSGKTFFSHYPLMLTPLICILAARGLDLAFSLSKGLDRKRVLAIFLLGFLVVHFTFAGAAYLGLPARESDVRMKLEAANYVRNITNESDKIWTSESDIGFFAQRMIVTPKSQYWKFQGFYEDVWGYFGLEYVGQYSGYPYGLITLTDIRLAIEEEKPKVVIFMESKITDYFVWYGISNSNYKEIGLADYILSNYYLQTEIHDIRIYVRK